MKVLKYPRCTEEQLYRKHGQWKGGKEAHIDRRVKVGGDQETLHRGIA